MKKNLLKSNAADVVFHNVSKLYGKDVVAVDDISLTVTAGTLVTLLGPSGCGKTTTLRMIAGLETANAGTVLIGNKDVTALPAADRDVSMVFQSYALFPHMTVLENVSFGLKFSGFTKDDTFQKAIAGLDLVCLKHLSARLPSELSGGQQQRVAVARALVLEPQVLLFDEPLSNLDAKLRRSVREEIKDIQKGLGLTVVYVTHDQEEALAVSDKIIVMNKGKIAQQGTPRDLYERPASIFVADFIGESNLLDCIIKSVRGNQASVQLGSIHLNVSCKGMTPGPAKMAVRPAHIGINFKNEGEMLAAQVRKATYTGSRMEYEVDAECGLFFITSPDVGKPLLEKQPIYLAFDPQTLILF